MDCALLDSTSEGGGGKDRYDRGIKPVATPTTSTTTDELTTTTDELTTTTVEEATTTTEEAATTTEDAATTSSATATATAAFAVCDSSLFTLREIGGRYPGEYIVDGPNDRSVGAADYRYVLSTADRTAAGLYHLVGSNIESIANSPPDAGWSGNTRDNAAIFEASPSIDAATGFRCCPAHFPPILPTLEAESCHVRMRIIGNS
jgi:hypothetical protein